LFGTPKIILGVGVVTRDIPELSTAENTIIVENFTKKECLVPL
jgi:hypothetical protein